MVFPGIARRGAAITSCFGVQIDDADALADLRVLSRRNQYLEQCPRRGGRYVLGDLLRFECVQDIAHRETLARRLEPRGNGRLLHVHAHAHELERDFHAARRRAPICRTAATIFSTLGSTSASAPGAYGIATFGILTRLTGAFSDWKPLSAASAAM